MESKKTISIIDDDESILQFLEAQLSSSFLIQTYKNGTEGIEGVKKQKPDLLLVDAALPDIKGDRVVQALRETYSSDQLPIIVISAYLRKDKNPDELLRRWQVSGFFPKPIDVEKLKSMITELTGSMIHLIENNDSSPGGLENLRADYFNHLQEKLKTIDNALNAFKKESLRSELAKIQAITHQIMGSAGSYGFLEIADSAGKLEHFCTTSMDGTAPAGAFEISRITFLYNQLDRSVRKAIMENQVETHKGKGLLVFVGKEAAPELEKESKQQGIEFIHAQRGDDVVRIARGQHIDWLLVQGKGQGAAELDFVHVARNLSHSKEIVFGYISSGKDDQKMIAARLGAQMFFAESDAPVSILHELRTYTQESTQGVVVLVDDDRFTFERLKQILAPSGYAVEWIEDASNVLDQIHRLHPSLIMIDYEMPGFKGPELCKALRLDRTLASVPIVVYTAHQEEEYRLRALKTGALDVILKTCRPEELRMKVTNLLHLQRAAFKEAESTEGILLLGAETLDR